MNSNGNTNYNDCNWDHGVRPFWDGKRSGVSNKLKPESHHQKRRYPFLYVKQKDKYKGTKYYDRR